MQQLYISHTWAVLLILACGEQIIDDPQWSYHNSNSTSATRTLISIISDSNSYTGYMTHSECNKCINEHAAVVYLRHELLGA